MNTYKDVKSLFKELNIPLGVLRLYGIDETQFKGIEEITEEEYNEQMTAATKSKQEMYTFEMSDSILGSSSPYKNSYETILSSDDGPPLKKFQFSQNQQQILESEFETISSEQSIITSLQNSEA